MSLPRVRQHQGSRWALPRARLSARCQTLLISARASLQRFCREASDTSLCGRLTWGGEHDINRMSGEGRFKTANSDEWAHGALPGKRPSRPCLAPPAGGLALHSRWSTKPTEAGTESGPPQTPAEAAGKDETLKSLRWIKSVSRYFEWISRGQITENVGKLQRVKLWNNDVVTSSGAVPTASQEEKMIIASYVIKVWPVFLDWEATRVHCSASQLFYVILCLPTLRRDDK